MGDHGRDTGDRLGGLRLEQAHRILVLECAVVQESKPAKELALSTSFELHHQRPWQPELIFLWLQPFSSTLEGCSRFLIAC